LGMPLHSLRSHRMDGYPVQDGMIPFREMEVSDREWIVSCRDPRRHPFTALSFTSLFSWRKTYGFTIAGDQDFFVIRSRHDNAYYCPCGEEEKCARFMRETLREESGARFLYLTGEQSRDLQEAGFQILPRNDLSEYLSDPASLALEEGHHASNSYKMKVRHFHKNTPYTVRPLSESDLPLMLEIAGKHPGVVGDEEVLREEIAHFDLLGLEGLLLETDAGLRAFILGYQDREDVFTMTMSKHESGLPGEITAVLVHALACRLAGKYRLINLEEDLGLSGLRQAKMLYNPVERLNVYEAVK